VRQERTLLEAAEGERERREMAGSRVSSISISIMLMVSRVGALLEEDCLQGDAATNSVPMIGRRGERRDSPDEGRDPTFSGEDQKRGLPYPIPPSINADWNWQKRDADWDWHIERASRRRKLMLTTPGPPMLKMSKRGPPRFGLPGHWSRKTKRRPGLASLRSQLYQGFRFHPGSQDRRPLVHKRDPSFWEGAGEARQRWGRPAPSGPQWLQKRGLGEPGDETWQLNSVPFMGKRTMEKGEEGLGQGDLMIRVPREGMEGEEDEEATNPWQFLLLDPRRVSRPSQASRAGVRGLTKALRFI